MTVSLRCVTSCTDAVPRATADCAFRLAAHRRTALLMMSFSSIQVLFCGKVTRWSGRGCAKVHLSAPFGLSVRTFQAPYAHRSPLPLRRRFRKADLQVLSDVCAMGDEVPAGWCADQLGRPLLRIFLLKTADSLLQDRMLPPARNLQLLLSASYRSLHEKVLHLSG